LNPRAARYANLPGNSCPDGRASQWNGSVESNRCAIEDASDALDRASGSKVARRANGRPGESLVADELEPVPACAEARTVVGRGGETGTQ
jgi:hypothetical protein